MQISNFTSLKELFKDPRRWIKNSYNQPKYIDGVETEGYCLVGALRAIYNTHTTQFNTAKAKVYTAIKNYELGQFFDVMENWNDDAARDVKDIQRIVALADV